MYRLLGPSLQDITLNPDSERDLLRVARLLDHGELYAAGPSAMGEKSPLGIGPLWYLLAAPALYLDAHASTAYVLHVAVFVVGLGLLLWALVRPGVGWGALIVGPLMASGRYPLALLTLLLTRLTASYLLAATPVPATPGQTATG